jgi:hypothetical protein
MTTMRRTTRPPSAGMRDVRLAVIEVPVCPGILALSSCNFMREERIAS